MSKELTPCPMCESTDIATYSYNADDHGMSWETYHKCKKCGRTASDYCWGDLTKEERLTVENRQLKAEVDKLKAEVERLKNELETIYKISHAAHQDKVARAFMRDIAHRALFKPFWEAIKKDEPAP